MILKTLKRKLSKHRLKINFGGLIILFFIGLWFIRQDNNDMILDKYPEEEKKQDNSNGPFGEVISVESSDKKGELRVCFEQKPDKTIVQGNNCRTVPIECIMRVFPDPCKVEEYIFIPHVDCSTRKCDKGCSKKCLTVRIKEIEKSKHLIR